MELKLGNIYQHVRNHNHYVIKDITTAAGDTNGSDVSPKAIFLYKATHTETEEEWNVFGDRVLTYLYSPQRKIWAGAPFVIYTNVLRPEWPIFARPLHIFRSGCFKQINHRAIVIRQLRLHQTLNPHSSTLL